MHYYLRFTKYFIYLQFLPWKCKLRQIAIRLQDLFASRRER
jgi:hypothetical protein